MESEVGAVAMNEPAAPAPPNVSRGWIVSPLFDLVFFANVLWLFAFIPGFVAPEGTPHIEFWQLYFLTVPHRWITLILVATDRERRDGRNYQFIAIAGVACLAIVGVWLVTGGLLCLLLIDYLWNGWHFASQHAGILRIYSRKTGGGWPTLERWGLRFFIFYTIARTAGWSTGWLDEVALGPESLRIVDLVALCLPVLLLATELRGLCIAQTGKLVYLASVCGLYASLLIALSGQYTILIFALTAAGAAFHAIEYLALVTHYAWRQSANAGDTIFLAMARRWLGFLATYVVLLGFMAWLFHGIEWWLGLNLWAAFLHYAYDGMIWKLRRPGTAQVLGATLLPEGTT